MSDDIVYLDYAATSALRPRQVVDAVASYLSETGATPGRGGHRLAVEAGRVALRCRQALARLLGARGDPGRIALLSNATEALNTMFSGMLRPRDVVVRTMLDHNAVRRPLLRLQRERDIEVRLMPANSAGELELGSAARLLDGARLLVVNGASNVLGTVPPLAELAALAHDAGALFAVDAAQSAGHVAFDVEADGIDVVAFTGHKALLGPQGTGGLWAREGIEIEPLIVGGSGGDSLLEDMPVAWPDRLEAGTRNGPGIAGLLAGVEWVLDYGVERMHARLAELKLQLWDGLRGIDDVQVLSPRDPTGTPVVTMRVDGQDVTRTARRLDVEHGVLTRAGLHCAPEAHVLLGTTKTGAVRLSLGWSSEERDVERAIRAVAAVARSGNASGSPPVAQPVGEETAGAHR